MTKFKGNGAKKQKNRIYLYFFNNFSPKYDKFAHIIALCYCLIYDDNNIVTSDKKFKKWGNFFFITHGTTLIISALLFCFLVNRFN